MTDNTTTTPQSTQVDTICELCHSESNMALSHVVGYPDIKCCTNCTRAFDGFSGKIQQNAKFDQIASIRDSRLPKEDKPKGFFDHLKKFFAK